MKIIDKFCEKVGITSPEEDIEEDYEEDGEEESPARERQTKFEPPPPPPPHNVVDFHSAITARESASATHKMKVVIIEPKSFDDAQQVANCLREKRPVLINFERTEGDIAKRIIDFISGTTYALNGEIKKVGQNVFLCAPANVNVTHTEEEKKVSTDMPWLKK